MKANGYAPNTSLVVQNVDEQTKEEMLLGHSEKLAIGLGLICTSQGTRITIKNLRVCVDCHSATMFISKIEGRAIVARDLNKFHRFKDGDKCRLHKDSWVGQKVMVGIEGSHVKLKLLTRLFGAGISYLSWSGAGLQLKVKESLLDTVAQEGEELENVMKELSTNMH
ncbi:hypothetical protein GIB67_009437 [Kingdonia uniflora]|uniref:DYW domain-containing protein n=1 Tax=Kingdonia uniflora TaxID=39325 RepID=A0A7J7N3S5_9MAGN|nr:hypothetical protein GIB67_009437 [Kingdonia uniflora]